MRGDCDVASLRDTLSFPPRPGDRLLGEFYDIVLRVLPEKTHESAVR